MINAGTVAAYLTLDTGQFEQGLTTAGQRLQTFKQSYADKAGGGIWETIGTVMSERVMKPIGGAGAAIAAFAEKFGEAARSVRERTAGVGTAAETVRGSVLTLGNAVHGASGDIALLNSAVNDSRSAADTAGEMAAHVRESAESVRSIAAELSGQAMEQIRAAQMGMRAELEGAYPALYAAAKGGAERITGAVDEVLGITSDSSVMRQKGILTVNGWINGMRSRQETVTETMGGIMRDALSAAQAVDFTPAGGSIVSGILTGMNQRKGALLSAAESIASGISSRIKAALQINSPSKVMIPIGESVAEGMALGLSRGAAGLYQTASAVSGETAEVMGSISMGTRPTTFGESNDTLDRLLEAVERLADSRSTVEIDGRAFGKLVREYV